MTRFVLFLSTLLGALSTSVVAAAEAGTDPGTQAGTQAGTQTWHRAVTIEPEPDLTPEQHRQALQQVILERAALIDQVGAAVREHRSDSELAGRRRAIARYDSLILDLQFRPMVTELISAICANDLTRFHAPCDAAMTTAITAEVLSGVATAVHADIPDGRYLIIPGGSFHRTQQEVLLYIIRPIAGGDDILATMSVADGKCTGLLLK